MYPIVEDNLGNTIKVACVLDGENPLWQPCIVNGEELIPLDGTRLYYLKDNAVTKLLQLVNMNNWVIVNWE